MNLATTMQIVTHAFLWIFLLSYELFASVAITFVPQNHWVYALAGGLALIAFCLLHHMGNSGLLFDMRELFFYEVCIQFYGAICYYNGSNLFIYEVLINTLLILKFTRLLWIRREVELSADARWPVFGVLGWRAQRRHGALPAGDALAKGAAYGCIALAFLLSLLFAKIGFNRSLMLCGLVPLVLIGIYYKRFLRYLTRTELVRLEAEKNLAVTKATAQINEELRSKNEQLLRANQERDVMLADLMVRNEYLRDASHDLAAPAFWITSCAQQLANAKDDTSRAELCEQLLDSVGHYNQLLQATIHAAKLITHMEQPTLVPLSVNRLANHLWDKYLAIFETKGLRFGIYKANQYLLTGDGEPVPDVNPERRALAFQIACDEHILMRILNNLIMNALRHTDQGRVRVAFRRRAHGVCWIEVRDTGKGFPNANGPDWAANFERVAQDIKNGKMKASEAASHGLGINNIRNLCSTIGCRMLLYSVPGQGSIFRFVVPLAESSIPSPLLDVEQVHSSA